MVIWTTCIEEENKTKLNLDYFGWSVSLKKACSETLNKVHNINPQFSICCVCFNVTLYMQITIGKGKHPSLLFIVILANAMNSTLEVFEVTSCSIKLIQHEPLSWVATQSVLKFRESLRISRKIGLRKLGKIYKQEVPNFFRSFSGETK